MFVSVVNSNIYGSMPKKALNTSQNTSSNYVSKNSISNNLIYPALNNLQAYHLKNNPSFGQLRIDHLRNGAYVDEAKNVFFKLFTYDDALKVFVDIQGKGLHQLQKIKDGIGIFEKQMSSEQVSIGDKYRFLIERGDGNIIYVKDPYAMKRDSVWNDFSEIYSHHEFKWNDADWMEKKIPQKVSRLSSQNGLLPVNGLKIYEVNIATLTKDGNFEAAKTCIDELAEDGIFNAIEIMPVENTHSFNWGYDGVDKFAVQESVLGGPDKLKELINYAHSKKINVIMDVVPNHIGFDGSMLYKTGPYINTHSGSPFGEPFNLEHYPNHNKHVRAYLANMCLNWLDNYHCDGLRLDMTKYMHSDYSMKQIAKEVHYHYPDAILIAEDGRENLHKVTQPLKPFEELLGRSENEHAQIMELQDEKLSLDNLGYDLEWNFPLFHKLYDAIVNSSEIKKLADTAKSAFNRVQYPMSHDEIGNMDGTRLISKLVNAKLNTFAKVSALDVTERYQKSAHATQAILESKVSGEFDRFTPTERGVFLNKLGVNTDVTPEEVEQILIEAISGHKLALGNVFAIPGVKMVFQGDEAGALNYFKFFRQLSPIKADRDAYDLADKGYEPGLSAFMDSKMDSINYSPEYKEIMSKIKAFTKDISKLSEKIPALNSGEVTQNTIANEASKVLGVHLKKGESEIFSISNFDTFSYDNDYEIKLPKGRWREILNSNALEYAGNGEFKNTGVVFDSDGVIKNFLYLPGRSIILLEKID
jgi:1,4-alpha-glucan branching enzyme